jgi:hypothetical protein
MSGIAREAADPGSRSSSFEIKRYAEACHGMRACKHRADFCSALRRSDGGLSPCFNRGRVNAMTHWQVSARLHH